MQLKFDVHKTVYHEIDTVRIFAKVRYMEDFSDDFYGLDDKGYLNLSIDADTGHIHGWPKGLVGECYAKICDQGSYYLDGTDGNVFAQLENGYVPSFLPGKYGDYLDLKVDGDGIIKDWHKSFNDENVNSESDNYEYMF